MVCSNGHCLFWGRSVDVVVMLFYSILLKGSRLSATWHIHECGIYHSCKKMWCPNESAKSHICASDSRIHDCQMSDGDKSDAQLLLKRHTHVICWGQNGCPTVIVFKMTKIGKYCGVQLLLQSHTFLKRINTVLNFIWHIRDNYFWKLDPVGSTLSYKMIKLCTGSV